MTLLQIIFAEVPGGLVMTGQLLLSLSILVFVHELGHFLAAKAFGMRVDKFYVFFDFGGKKIFSITKGETEYGLGWFPLGGYVKIAGMIDESMDKEQMNTEPQDWEFRSKPAWQRFIVMIGGVVMNVILGVIIYAFWLNQYQERYIPVAEMQEGVYAHELARDLGFETGDRVVAVNGSTPERYKDITPLKIYFGGEITVERDGEIKDVKIPGDLFKQIKEPLFSPLYEKVVVQRVFEGSNAEKGNLEVGDVIKGVDGKETTNFASFGELLRSHSGKSTTIAVNRGGELVTLNVDVPEEGKIGFESNVTTDTEKYPMKDYTWGSSLRYGSREAFATFVTQVIGFGKLLRGKIPVRDSVQSPVGIATIFGSVWDWSKFWLLTAMISIVLAFMNILPIPALDGGHIVFIGIEMITGKPVSETVIEKAQVVGMVFLLTLMVLVVGNDILKLFGI
ncbi:MAG: RIP metalloprotease RseP [Chitinophagales bacterium]|nr:RIP metalloprotease RseP [Chitinophagales bacterium]